VSPRGGAVGGLVPWWLRRGPVGPYHAIIARELRYWVRDNRRRIALVSGALSGVTLPLSWSLDGVAGAHGPGVTFSSSFSALIGGSMMFQVYSMDGTAFATNLLSGVRARIDLRARVIALSLLLLPVLGVLATGVAVLTGRAEDLPAAYGALVATFGVAAGTATSFAIDGAFPMPEVRNPFAMRTGTGTVRGLLMLVVMILTLTFTLPVYIAIFFAPTWARIPIGVAWGVIAALIGTTVAASRLAKRGPELLLAVTPRR
jgi:ABC-2 type transport system permease protein